MKVSVLVPIYGVEQYIERCARSLFEQSYVDLEYVFVNDCTFDNSIEVLKRVIEDYPTRKTTVKIINHERNRGVAATRNTLLDYAKGDFVSWVDADDWLELDALELLVKKQMETNVDIVSGNAKMYYPDRVEELEQSVDLSKKEIVLGKLGNGWQNVLWGRIIRRSLIEDNGLRALEGSNMAEDKYLMALISYYAETFAVCEEFVYNYERRNDQSITGQQSKDKIMKRGLQYLQNYTGLQSFFSDKEIDYYEEVSKHTMLYAFVVLKMVVKFNEKKHFPYVAAVLDSTTNKYWPLIGWETRGIKGALMHNYSFMWLKLTAQRMSRFIKRKTQ